MKLNLHHAALAAFLLASAAFADTAAPGYSLEVLPGGGAYRTTTLSNGEFIGHDSKTVRRFAEDGTLIQTLHTFPIGVVAFPSDVVVDPTENFALVSRSMGYNGGSVYQVDLATGATSFVTGYSPTDMVFESQTSVLMAITDGVSGYTIRRLDLTTGQVTEISENFASASIDMDAAGNLYVAYVNNGDAFIERFDPAALAGPGLLLGGGGTIVADQINQPWVLTVSDDGQNYYVIDRFSFSDSLLLQLGKGGPRLLATIDESSRVDDLELVRPTPPVAQILGGPRLSGELIYQADPGTGHVRTKVTPAGAGPVPIGPALRRALFGQDF